MAGVKVIYLIAGQEVEREYTEEQVARLQQQRAMAGIEPAGDAGGDGGDGGDAGGEAAAEPEVKKTRTRKKV